MSLVHFLPVLLLCSCDANVSLEGNTNHNVVSCVTGILKQYFKRTKVTYVDINYRSNEIIKVIHSLPRSIISRDTTKKLPSSNLQYVVAAGTSVDFTSHFPVLMKEPRWNPNAMFCVIINSLDPKDLRSIFDVLLKFHVNDVVVLNGTEEVDLFSYNPFDKYNCGKKYDDIMEFGKCLTSGVKDFYPYKLVTGLRNCTFNATMSHWPPYAIDNKISNDSSVGAEQYILQIISEQEDFKVKYTRSISGEEFSTISDNMTASGDLYMLQEKLTDIMFGGMLLMHFRADAFNFLCGHLPFIDNIRTFVQKTGIVSGWKNLFLEFETSVWLVLIVTFLVYFTLVVAILRVKDRASLFLIMFDLFFLHGSKIIFKSKRIFISWVFFAYLISTYYQSSMFSIITNPSKNYQISTDEDLVEYNIKPCISLGLQKYLNELKPKPVELVYERGCIEMIESIRSVSRSSKKYTISLYSVYLYNRYVFSNEREEDPIYAFKRPTNNIIFAFYLDKGFPLRDKLELYTVRLRENGLIDRHLRKLHEKSRITFFKTAKRNITNKLEILFPCYILLVGYIVASSSFLLEVFSKKKPRTNFVI